MGFSPSTIISNIQLLTGLCLQSLDHRFVAWTIPDTTSLLLGTLTDLARSKSELVAENALLRTSRIEILTTPYHAPRANAIFERFLGSVRRECPDHLLILQEKKFQRVLNAYMLSFHRARPHQGIRQQIPESQVGRCQQIMQLVRSSHSGCRWAPS